MKILCMGQITYDYSLPIDGFPIEGLKYNLKEKIESSGGGACNAAYLLAKWNEEVYLSAAVGNDELGSKIRKDIEDAGIHAHTVEIAFDSKTPISFILINKNTGNKTSFAISETEPHVKKYELDFIPDIIYFDGYEYTSTISIVNKFPNAITIFDASEYTKQNVEMCPYAKYIIASQAFAEGLTGQKMDFANPTTLLEIYKKVAAKYPNSQIVITLKDHGAMYLDQNQIKVMPGLKVESIKDATGAGDIFRAAFVAGIARNYDIEKNIRIANISAGLSLKTIGAKDSIPLFSDVAQYYETKFGAIETAAPKVEQQTQAPVANATNTVEQPVTTATTVTEQPTPVANTTVAPEQSTVAPAATTEASAIQPQANPLPQNGSE